MKTTNKIYKDFRSSYSTAIEIVSGRPYFGGVPVAELNKTDGNGIFKSKHLYSIVCAGMNCGSIALENKEVKEIQNLLPFDFDRVSGGRIVCHFLRLLNQGDNIKGDHSRSDHFGINHKYDLAIIKAKKIGGKKFHNKQYGGGIVFESTDIVATSEKIRSIKEVNTNFLKEWTPKQFKQVDKAIYNHFSTYKYQYIDDHSKPAKDFNPFTFEQVDNALGLAYTSTGDYAGNWVCNGINVMVNDTHHFIGFAINELGQVIGIADDKDEKSIYIEL